ncbi:hypothetical protein DXA38_05970 [[Clostridium] innocuum]|uniref:Uncharacterized protein n=1 Tax=Clostridium innocuum TaxID=1522 RepID=A0A3E2VZK2_CLOIN|nr:hypothetical protein DXA38_05970 [[Clostridium] innocuum]RHV65831.1 hypothetical protein DXB22_07870 [Clostridiaceae bacterium OM02-2AC]
MFAVLSDVHRYKKESAFPGCLLGFGQIKIKDFNTIVFFNSVEILFLQPLKRRKEPFLWNSPF